ncbi:hypothetical protein GPECTOR_1g796 [Gonium pectorale]|uniref:Lipoyl-binding domain-containing protein n=1 Tax=Gonium pectorale TaxID=33097 RepID=A0A150H4A3_GONPE|nr:hypothetical protein GPECTOR_1g796 [Gonium pectorale]|eukprot:KXZ56882.1 hypothetical protein GPECTOR_1g796 [Gonium pectorale]
MGESVTEGSISAVLKKVGDPVAVDEDIAQVEAGKAAIGIKAPVAGVLERLMVKASDTVVPGQVVAVIGAAAPAAAAAGGGAGAAAVAASGSLDTGRAAMIRFPPRVTAAGKRISDLPAAEYEAAVAAASAPPVPAAPQPSAPAVAAAAAPAAPAASHPVAAARAAPPPTPKNRLTFVTRPDGRGGPPRRELTARELDMVNLGGAA